MSAGNKSAEEGEGADLEGVAADELERVEHHLERNHVGKPPDHSRN